MRITINIDVVAARALAKAASVRAEKLLAVARRGDRAGFPEHAAMLKAEAELVERTARAIHTAAVEAAAGSMTRG